MLRYVALDVSKGDDMKARTHDPMTNGTGLLALARLMEDLNSDSGLLNDPIKKMLRLIRLVDLAETTIYREVAHINWRYKTRCSEAMTDALNLVAHKRGWESSVDGNETYPSDDDMMRVLTTPMEPALLLNIVAEGLGIDTPEIVEQAIRILKEPQQSAA